MTQQQTGRRMQTGLWAVLLMLVGSSVWSQTPRSWPLSERSHTAHASRISRYRNPAIPTRFPDNRKAQNLYAKAIRARNELIVSFIEDDDLIQDTLLEARCQAVIHRLQQANPDFNFKDLAVLIGRSADPNAFCFGEGTVIVNLGLFLLAEPDDELALVLAHELSHQFLNHNDQRYQRRVSLETSKDYKEELRSLRQHAADGADRYLALKTRLYTEEGQYSRSEELAADSLGKRLVQQAGYELSKGAVLLLKMHQSDALLEGADQYDLTRIFAPVSDSGLQKPTRYSGLSAARVQLNVTNPFDSLKNSHPDALLRYTALTGTPPPALQVAPAAILKRTATAEKSRQLQELIAYQIQNQHWTAALHYSFLALEAGFPEAPFNDLIALAFSGIYSADQRGERYSATYAYTSRACTLRELQARLLQLRSAQLATLAAHYLKTGASNAGTESHELAQVAYRIAVEHTDRTVAIQQYQTLFPHHTAGYLLDAF